METSIIFDLLKCLNSKFYLIYKLDKNWIFASKTVMKNQWYGAH